MASYSSDQQVATATGDAQMVPTTQRARLTGIQAEGASGSKIIFKSGGSSGTTIATFDFGDEGINFYVPGSGILFEEGIYLDLTTTPSVTITFT
jgi:hypothetical protein|tara:strand:+ start:45 stop:326 length:282 start_codon:yes stop_codon:yes gene_type:complete